LGLTRRDFIKAGAFLAASTPLLEVPRALNFPIDRVLAQQPKPFEERFVPSVCLQCPAGCGIIVRVLNGRAVKIEGDPRSPNNRGAICPKGHLGLQILYDPDRIKGPMYRKERGTDKWVRVTWKEAIGMVADKLVELRKAGEPHKFVWLDGRVRGNMGAFRTRFLSAYGTPNVINHSNICSDGAKLGHYLTQGVKDYLGYDWERANYILVFGGGLIEAWRPTTRLLRVYGKVRRERPIRARIVVVDTRLSISAAKADQWIPIKPGTDGALALALIHVIIRDKLYDAKYIEEHTVGFEEFKEIVLKEYTPDWASKITDVPSETIERVARDFATTKPSIAAGQRGAMMWSNGVYTYMAIHSLNALVGSIGVPGGIIVQKGAPFKDFPPLKLDEIAKEGLKRTRVDLVGSVEFPFASNNRTAVTDALLSGKPYRPSVVMTYYTNPLFSDPEIDRAYAAYAKLDMAISTSPFMSEFEEYIADILLPENSYLERWHDDTIYPSIGYPYVGMRQPVVDQLYDTMNVGDTLLRLAKEIGARGYPELADNFPWESYVDVLKYRWRGIFDSKKGRIGPMSVSSFQTFDEFWSSLLKYGYWANPPYTFGNWKHEFRTYSGKFEFRSGKLEKSLKQFVDEMVKKEGLVPEAAKDRILSLWNVKVRDKRVYFPHWEEPLVAGDPEKYPFFLNTYKLMMHAEGRGSNCPWVLEHLSSYFPGIKYETWVEINPNDAAKIGVSNGDYVELTSPKGQKIRALAILFEGTKPGVVNVPYELGHKAYGRWANGTGSNPNSLIIEEWEGNVLRDRFSASINYFATRVNIRRLEKGQRL